MPYLNSSQLRQLFDNRVILLIEDEPQSDTYSQIIPSSDQLDEMAYLLQDFFVEGVLVGDRMISLPSDIEHFHDGERDEQELIG